MRGLGVTVLLGACASSPPAPPATRAAAATARPVRVTEAELDRGSFIVLEQGRPAGTETFSITRKGERLVLRSTSVRASRTSGEGELETDLAFRPIRAAFRRSGTSYTVDGNPLTLREVRGEATPNAPVVATGPVELFLDGPGVVAIAPLCRVTPGVILHVLASRESVPTATVRVRPPRPAASLQYIAAELDGDVMGDVYCDGEQLVAFGIEAAEVWFIRQGREQEVAAAHSVVSSKN